MSYTAEELDWKVEIREKLCLVFPGFDNVEDLLRILFHLDEDDRKYEFDTETSPAWNTLRSTLNHELVFQKFATRLAQDTRLPEMDIRFLEIINSINSKIASNPIDTTQDPEFPGFAIVSPVADLDISTFAGFSGLVKSWGFISPVNQSQILASIPTMAESRQVALRDNSDLAGFKYEVCRAGLAAVSLGEGALQSMQGWWGGEINGRQCAKTVVDSGLVMGAGFGGSMCGARLGSCAGSVGTLIGFVGGWYLSTTAVTNTVENLTQRLFGVPKDKSVENAYLFFGLKSTASDAEVNEAFRKICLEHHPDKGGDGEYFIMSQMQMSIIKLSRYGKA